MPAPFLRMRGHHAIGGDNRKLEPAGCSEHRMALTAGPELGVKVLWTTEPECLLEEAGVTGKEDEAVPIGCQVL